MEAEGKTLGRPRSVEGNVLESVKAKLAAGETIAAIAKAHNTSRQTIMRIRDELARAC